jgi:hypothetical protein
VHHIIRANFPGALAENRQALAKARAVIHECDVEYLIVFACDIHLLPASVDVNRAPGSAEGGVSGVGCAGRHDQKRQNNYYPVQGG